jgi:hypothetical protein
MSFSCDRRRFLRNSVVLAATPLFPNPAASSLGLAGDASPDTPGPDLRSGFLDPPDAARPWVYAIVMDGNLTREGITADLEAMHRVGIRGLMYFEVDQFVPKGPVRFLTTAWREMLQHLMNEASRLGITINANNDGGYCGSGGPWVTPELSMQMLVWSEARIQGPGRVSQTLRQPRTIRDYYRDVAVLAFPTPPAESVRMADHAPVLTYGLDRRPFDFAPLIDGDLATAAVLPPTPEGQPQYLNIEFPEPFVARALTLALDPWNAEVTGTLEVSDEGRDFRPVRSYTLRWPVSSVNFPAVTARHYRLSMQGPSEDYDWLFRTFAKGYPIAEVELHAGLRIEDIPGKAAYIRRDLNLGEADIPAEMATNRELILDLSRYMTSDGHLTWYAPPGGWTVLRIGHTSTGKMNHPAPQESVGLECDKLSRRAIEVHFDGFVRKLVQDQAAVGAKALTMTHIDSWETGGQNWTPGLREEFQKRRGYDLLPYLAVLTGRAVENREVSERFLWDLRQTVGDLLLDNYAGHLQEISHRHGLTLSIEGYGGGPVSDVAYAGRADIPMCEFWTGMPAWWDLLMGWCKAMASAAHLYGSKILMAESFTAEPQGAKWQNHPYQLKTLGDLAFTLGVNRMVFHRYAMQPWLDPKPGMTMGAFGIHHERTNTWWEQSRAWHEYLSRCQFLLQQGQFVADVAYLGSENSPHSFPRRELLEPAIPPGYDFDDLPPEVLLDRAAVRGGLLVFPTGMSYRVLVLPPGRTMTPALLRRVKELVLAGATVVGQPPESSPSLANYPRCDEEVRQLAADLWGGCDGVSIAENRFGQGRVVWGKPLQDVLTSLGARPDFTCRDAAVGSDIRYVHRATDGEDIYFVASAIPEERRFLCTFRVSGKHPELWWPDTGRIESVALFDERDGATHIPLTLDPCGSVFVVFRPHSELAAEGVISVRRNGVEISGLAPSPAAGFQLQHEFGAFTLSEVESAEYRLEVTQPGNYVMKTTKGKILRAEIPSLPHPTAIDGPWELEFPKGWGAPERVRLERLISWTDHADPGVKYFSGAATYRRKLGLPHALLAKDRRLYLDLGRVAVIAEVMLNGHDLGILWKPPFRAEITDVVRSGVNDLEVKVVNLWPNRLIGDAHLPEDCEWQPPATSANLVPKTWGDVLKRWPRWLLDGKPSPTGRHTFTTWKHWTKDDPLLESGLLGPVTLLATALVKVAP